MSIDFRVDKTLCTKCGTCVADCVAMVLAMEDDGFPAVRAGKEDDCIGCQHCLAVCPVAAVSVLGKKPADSLPLAGRLPDADRLETLIKGRRSVRRFADENLPPKVVQRLLDVAGHAPTGVNDRRVLFSVVDDRAVMAKLRTDLYEQIGALADSGKLPEKMAFFAGFVKVWKEKKIDPIFRGAPHLLVVSAPADAPTPEADCLIAMTTFDLFAPTVGVGTVWGGLPTWAITTIAPEFKARLGVPDSHRFGYAMPFGRPTVNYHRTVQHAPAQVHRVS
ncbi:MAG: 4Fe-4S dicluster domain-containing protein [Candidatus Riflebacteria bacterium]|nr:4Fe-4S dicluster domain-containing protein [Candidatus Riflebacteria bacterium]